jgi:hypothetical protein
VANIQSFLLRSIPLDWGACDLDRVSFGVKHKLVYPIVVNLEDIVLVAAVRIHSKLHLKEGHLPVHR